MKRFISITSIFALILCSSVFASSPQYSNNYYQSFQPDFTSIITGALGLINWIGMFLIFKKARVNPLWTLVPLYNCKKQGDIARKPFLGILAMILSILTIVLLVPMAITLINMIQSRGAGNMSELYASLIASSSGVLICGIATVVVGILLNYNTMQRFTNVPTWVSILGLFYPGVLGFIQNSNYKG